MAIIENKSKPVDDPGLHTVGSVKDIICKSPQYLLDILDALDLGKVHQYVSDGDFSLHQLVLAIIYKYDKADLWFTTFALRELPVRQLILAQSKGQIGSIKAIVDKRAKIRTPEVFQMLKMNACSLYQANIHAKVCVIETAKETITIVGSQNWTTNPKIESGIIILDKLTGEFNKSWMEKLMTDGTIFK